MFVSLHNHTEWSILDSIVKVNELFERAKELNQSSIAITDHGTFLAMWDALKVSKKTKVKLIVGCEFYFTPDPSQTEEHFKHIILLAKNQIGYKNLLALHYKGFSNIEQKFKKSYSVIDWKLLEEHSEGVICLTSCGNGILAKSILDKNIDEAISIAQRLKDIFKEDLGLEVQANNLKRPATFYNQKIDQNYLNRQIINIGKKLDIKVVPTCNTHYLKKEDHETHDVLLAIGCHQPVYSNFRLKYDVPDFYLKSEEEIKAFFSRNYGEEYAEEIIKNTEYFANKCENPVWVDPKFTNPSGKELPEIDPRTEPDYNEFLSWVDGKEDIKKKKLDHQYLRYKCDIGFQKHLKTIPEEQHKIYLDRIEEEFDVLEYKDFCSYMLIVADFLNWCRDNNIPVGTGRGCLTKDTQVLTEGGFITLDKINIGDKVYTHTGELKNVFNTFKYDINETGLEIKTNYSFKPISLTKDHKVYGVKNTNKRYPIDMSDCVPQWLEAKDLEVNDFIFMPWILDRKISIYHDVIINDKPCFDISRFIDSNSIIEEDSIVVSLPKNNDLSIRAIHKGTNICRGLISQIKAKKVKPSNYILERLSNYLESNSCDFESWLNDKNHVNHKVKRFIECNKDLYYFLGRWVGDGWSLKSKSNSYITGIAFHSDDQVGIDKIISYIKELGYTPSVYKSKTKKLTQVIFSSKMFYNFMRYLFPDYKDSSNTKHFPIHFRNLNDEFLKELILGYSHSDGSVENMDSTKTRDNFDSTSLRLILELKEALLYLKIPSGISTRKPYFSRGYSCKESYKLRCYGINSNIPERFVITDSGYYCRVTSIEEVELKEVYDISVEENTSYLTSNYAVHNSVGGSIIAYYIGIHQADPIKYDLIFARFQNKEKEAYPDIDNDIAPSGRQHLLKYLTIKYGADKVAHVSNYNRITPKIYVKDVCRALELGGSKDAAVELGNKIADSISNDSKSVLQTLKESPLFEEYTKQYPEILKHLKLDGIIRSAATHAGGVIISKRSLPEIVSVRKDIDGTMSVEYEKERAEENGLVKIDILGLSTLDTIALTNKIALQQSKTIKAPDYNEYDPEAYKLLSSGDTFCVFQLGTSGGTIDLCKKVKPSSIEDISNINSLARPSAKDIRDKFIKTKEGKLPVNILHSSLQRAFGKTLGFGLYEECLMYLGQDVAGWSLNSTDRLRKMTKDKGKNPEKVKKLKEEFIKDSINNGILEKDATTIWTDVIELFQGYGFNRCLYFLESIDIYTNEGEFVSTKQIKDIKAGDYVKSRDENTGLSIFVEVLDLHNNGILDIVEVELNTGEKVRCTMNHKFRTKETGEMLPLHLIMSQNLTIVVENE